MDVRLTQLRSTLLASLAAFRPHPRRLLKNRHSNSSTICTHIENAKYIATSTHLISVKTLTKALLTYTYINPLHSTSTKALQHLADIYTTKAENNDDKENAEVHRVKLIPRPTTSQDTTNKNTILQTKQVNQKTTRANTPIFEQPIIQSPIIILDDNLHAPNILTPEDDDTPPRRSRSYTPSPELPQKSTNKGRHLRCCALTLPEAVFLTRRKQGLKSSYPKS